MKDWYTAQSMTEPAEYDTTSSPTTVYQRKNIKKVTKEATEQEEAQEYFEYQERQMTKEEYQQLQAELESPATKMIMQTLSAIELQQEMLAEMVEV